MSPESDALFYQLLRSKETKFISVQNLKEEACNFCGFIATQQIQALLIAPLKSGNFVDCVIYLGYCSEKSYSAEDELLLNLFVESGSNMLDRFRVMEQLDQNITQREHELNVLYEIMSIAGEARESVPLLQQALDITLNALGCNTGVIHLVDPESRRLKVTVQKQFEKELLEWLELSGLYRELWVKVYSTCDMVRVKSLQTQSYYEQAGKDVTVLSYMGVPIQAKGNLLGVLSLFGSSDSFLEEGNQQLLLTIANQIGLSLENLNQRKRTEEALILEERQRLARDLHDSVSQSLYGLVLAADIGNKFLKIKAYPELSRTLSEIGEISLQSLKEMRLMLFELHPLTFDKVGLAGALDLRLNTVERRAEMETTLEIGGTEFIPPRIDLEIYWIITEALNNSLKHSFASQILISIKAVQDMVNIQVIDNGKGFSKEDQNSGGFGLSSMMERANRIGGNLEVESQKGIGTKIRIKIPLDQEMTERVEI